MLISNGTIREFGPDSGEPKGKVLVISPDEEPEVVRKLYGAGYRVVVASTPGEASEVIGQNNLEGIVIPEAPSSMEILDFASLLQNSEKQNSGKLKIFISRAAEPVRATFSFYGVSNETYLTTQDLLDRLKH